MASGRGFFHFGQGKAGQAEAVSGCSQEQGMWEAAGQSRGGGAGEWLQVDLGEAGEVSNYR